MLKKVLNSTKIAFDDSKLVFSTYFKSFQFALKHDRLGTFALISTSILDSVIKLGAGYVIKIIIDELVRTISIDKNYLQLSFYLFVLGLLFLSEMLLGILDGYFRRRSFRILNANSTYLLNDKLSSLELSDYDNPKVYDITTNAKDFSINYLNVFVQSGINSIGLMIGLFITSSAISSITGPIIVGLVAILLIPEIVIELILGKKSWGIGNSSAETRRSFYKTSDYLSDEKNIIETKIYNYKNYLLKYCKDVYDSYLQEVARYETRRLLIYFPISILSASAIVLPIVYYINTSIATSSIEVGSIAFLYSLTRNFNSSFAQVSRSIATIYQYGLNVSYFFQLLAIKPQLKLGTKSIDANKIKIEFRNVSFKYPNQKKYIINNLSFIINPHEKVAIVGENGAGKSTIVKLICRMYDVTSGEILLNGVNIKEYDLNEYYKKISILTQVFSTFHFDVKTNIGMGDVNQLDDLRKVKIAAKLANTDTFIEKYPNKYDQILSKQFPNGIEPSHGQWQKIAIARALFRDPEILILDEPTSAVDPVSEYKIFKNLYDYAKDRTLIIVSHRFSTVKEAERILVMSNGKIIESGSHNDLMNINGVYANAYLIQKNSLTKGDIENPTTLE